MKTKNVKAVTPFFTLKKGPLPDLVGRIKYPFREMEIGHYFDVPRELDHRVRVRASDQARKYNHRYRVNRIVREEDGVTCVRIQRIA